MRGCHREGGRRLTKDSDSEVGCVYCVVVRPKRFTMDWRMHTAVISRSSSSLHKISLLRETEKNVHVYAYVHENGVGSKKFGGGIGWLVEGEGTSKCHEEFCEIDVGKMDNRVSSERAREIHGELVFAAKSGFLADDVVEKTLT